MQTSGAQKYSVVTDLIRQHQRFVGWTLHRLKKHQDVYLAVRSHIFGVHLNWKKIILQ